MSIFNKSVPLIWAIGFAISRMRAGWRSRLIVIASILLTTVIAAMSPLYTSLVAQAGMLQRLDFQPDENVNINTRIGLRPADTDMDHVWGTLDNSVRESAQQTFDAVNPAWLNDINIWGESSPMFVVHNGSDIPDLKLRAAYYENWEWRVQVLEGAISSSESADISGAVSLEVATRFDLAIGDIITLDQRGWDSSLIFTTEITAIVAALENDDPFWMSPSPLRLDGAQNSTEANILVSRDELLTIIRDYTPEASSASGWRFLFDHGVLAFGRIAQAVGAVSNFEAELRSILDENGFSSTFNTNLNAVLNNYSQEMNLLNAPFGILMLQVAALVLFFLLITVTLSQRSERAELAMLQNRGALESQIILLRALEGGIVCAIAAIIAPFIARQALIALYPLLTETAPLILELDALPFIYSGVMSVWALGVLLVTLRPVLKLPLISAGGSTTRPGQQSWWQRYYLDLLLVVVGSIALFRLLATNTPFAQSLLSGLRVDPLLLIAPALLFVALGSLTLRLFPLLTVLAARLFAGRRGAESALATWSVSRDPAHYARLTFLLALAIGVGWFAISFQATLAQSYTDQSQYLVGADVRLFNQDIQLNPPPAAGLEIYSELAGVYEVTNGFRREDLKLDGLGIRSGQFLAVDPETFENTAYWRDDLGRLILPASSDLPEVGVLLPAETVRIGVRIRLRDLIINRQTGEYIDSVPLISSLFDDFTFLVRLRDADGTYSQIQLDPFAIEGVEDITELSRFNLNVSPFDPPEQIEAETSRLQAALEGVSGWVYFTAEIDTDLTSPLTLDTLYWRTDFSNSGWLPMAQRGLEIAGLIALDADEQPVTPDFMELENWSLTLDNPALVMTNQLERVSQDEGAVWSLAWSQRQERAAFGIALYPPVSSIPSVISRSFAADNALEVGASFDLSIDRRSYTFVVEDIAGYFPTLYDDQTPYIVADLSTLMYALNQGPGAAYYPNEVLIALNEGVDVHAWVETHTINPENLLGMSVLTAADTRAELSGDVLLLGLSRLLVIAFIISLILSVISLLAYTALNGQSRRDQFAVLRALGMSSGRIAASVALELVIVFGVAILLGMFMGLLLSSQVLPTLAISTDGSAITPPFLVEIDPTALLQYAALLIGLMTLVLIVTTVLIQRMSLSQALRYRGE